jgi:hypothetical protein
MLATGLFDFGAGVNTESWRKSFGIVLLAFCGSFFYRPCRVNPGCFCATDEREEPDEQDHSG